MTAIRGVNGPVGPNPAAAVDAAKTTDNLQARGSAGSPANTEIEASRLEALYAFFAGSTVPVDIPALAQALMQEGAISG